MELHRSRASGQEQAVHRSACIEPAWLSWISRICVHTYIDIPGGANFEPNEFVDVSEVIEKKKKAFSFHDSQISWMKKIGAGDVMKNMLIQSSFRGMQCGCDHAEAFISLNKYPRGRVKSYLPQYL